MKSLYIFFLLVILKNFLSGQEIRLTEINLQAHQVYMSPQKLYGKKVLRVVKDSAITLVDEPTFVRINNIQFKNGSIEVNVLSRLLKNAPSLARGFIGIAFRIDDKNQKFESIYIRPANGRADDQIRRNHSTQYFSYPDFKFDKLRKVSPEKYESYADMGLDEWIKMRIEIQGKNADLYLNEGKYPVLKVTDLKMGENSVGGIGLWVEVGTEGYFRNLKVINKP